MKKEVYLHKDGTQTAEMLAGRRPGGLARFEPERSALLVLDMQRYFLEADSHAYVPSGAMALENIHKLVNAYDRHGLPVVYTRHLNDEGNAGMMADWWREIIKRENPLSELTPELDTSKGMVLEKAQYDAFYGTELDALLREKNVTQVLVTGVMTHLCCETTARSAFMRGFRVFFCVDGTATYNREMHYGSLRALDHGFAHLVAAAEMLEALEGDSA